MQIGNSSYKVEQSVRRSSTFTRVLRLVLFSLSVLSFISAIVMPYCEGRENSIWAVPPLLPAEIVPLGLLFLIAAILFFFLVASLIRKSDILVATLFFLGSVMLFAGFFFINNQRLYLFGFTNYAKNVLTTEEWRSIARVAQAKMKPGDYLSAFDIMDEDGGSSEGQIAEKFAPRTAFKKWRVHAR